MGQKEREDALRRLRASSMYYDREGNPITPDECGLLLDSDQARVVAVTVVGEGVRVSTVWLGIDHGYGSKDPVIFETMVFGGPLDGHCVRYHTEEEALEGHAGVVAALRDER